MKGTEGRTGTGFGRRLARRGVVTFLLGGWAAGMASAGLINGDFSSPLDVGWTAYDVVTLDQGVAILGEDPIAWATLEQSFTLSVGTISLSFDYRPVFEQGGEETFTASLLDQSFGPLVSGDADPEVPDETYYFMHDWSSAGPVNHILADPGLVTLEDLGAGWTRVRLDLTGLGGLETEALLAFDFIPGFEDSSLEGRVELDNVSLGQGPAAVPVPRSLLLAALGCLAATHAVGDGAWRRLQ